MIKKLLLLFNAFSSGFALNNVANSNVVLDSTDLTRFNNWVNTDLINNELSYQAWSLSSLDFNEDFSYRSIFDNQGNLIVGGNYGLTCGIYTATRSNNIKFCSCDFMPQIQDFYLIFNVSNSTGITSSSYISINPENYLSAINSQHNLEVQFQIDTNYIRFGSTNGVYVYKLSWNDNLNYFVNKYGQCFKDSTHNVSMQFDGNVGGNVYFDAVNCDFTMSIYTESTLNYILNSSTNYNTGYNNGYNTGYNNGKNDTISQDYNGDSYQDIYNTGYNNGLAVGYNQGVASVSDSNSTIMGLFGAIANVPITILNGVMGPTLLGVPLITILLNFLSVLLILWLIKKFIK